MPFVHLHTHTDHTLLDSVLTVEKLVDRAVEMGHTHVAITDTAVLHGVVDFDKACRDKEGQLRIQPIFGATCWVHELLEGHPEVEGQIVLLVEDQLGWMNLCRLLTLGLAQVHHHPRVTLAQLAEHQVGLQVLTGGQHGLLARAASPEQALEIVLRLTGAVDPTKVTLELTDAALTAHVRLRTHLEVVRDVTGLPAVITNECCHLAPDHVGALELVRDIASSRTLETRNWEGTDQRYVKTEAELLDVFPGEQEALSYSQVLAARCTYELPRGRMLMPVTEPPIELSGHVPRWHWMVKSFPWPSWISEKPQVKAPCDDKLSPVMLRHFAWAGLSSRIPGHGKDYTQRLSHELDVIIGLGFDGYFLIVAEMVGWARAEGIPIGPGRGSGAGSLVAWCLGITALDPLRWGLLFERFLNAARGSGSPPDFDLDFAQARRGEVVGHLSDHYGVDRTAQILTIGTLAGLSAVKDSARIHQVYFNDSNAWTSHIKAVLTASSDKSLGVLDNVRSIRKLQETYPVFRSTLQHAQAVEGVARQTGVHPGGVVISDRPLTEVIPVHTETGTRAVGIDMKGVDALGLIKFDILGVKALDVIERACELVEEQTGDRPDPETFPEHDEATLDLLCTGNLYGLFQLKSRGMQRLCRQLQPNSIDDVCALVALYRPGPLNSGMTESFVERRHGREEETPIHPLLEEVLAPTHGLLVYQEQVMEAARVLAGYDLAEADILRRALGKKLPEVLRKQRSRFAAGCDTNGIDEAQATTIFNAIEKFSAYSFNKSHSAAYGVICWRTAYLKAHWPEAFMAAVMTWDAKEKDRLPRAIEEARNMGLAVLPPHIRHSRAGFSLVDGGVRLGFGALKGVGDGTARLLAQLAPTLQRPEDLRGQVDLKTVKALCAAGALDSLEPDRLRALERARTPPKSKPKKGKTAASQGALFPTLVQPKRGGEPEHEVPGQTWAERNLAELKVLGIVLTGSPLERYRGLMRDSCSTIEDLRRKGSVIGGTLLVVLDGVRKEERARRPTTYTLRLSDETGSIQALMVEGSAIFNPPEVVVRACVKVEVAPDERRHGHYVVTELADLETIRSAAVQDRRFVTEQGRDLQSAVLNIDSGTLSQAEGVELTEAILRHSVEEPTDESLELELRWTIPGRSIVVLTLPRQIVATPTLFEAIERLTGNPEALVVRGWAR